MTPRNQNRFDQTLQELRDRIGTPEERIPRTFRVWDTEGFGLKVGQGTRAAEEPATQTLIHDACVARVASGECALHIDGEHTVTFQFPDREIAFSASWFIGLKLTTLGIPVRPKNAARAVESDDAAFLGVGTAPEAAAKKPAKVRIGGI